MTGIRRAGCDALTEIPLIDTRSALCHSECRLQDSEGHLFYFDYGHLMLTGARQLEPALNAWFDGMERRPHVATR